MAEDDVELFNYHYQMLLYERECYTRTFDLKIRQKFAGFLLKIQQENPEKWVGYLRQMADERAALEMPVEPDLYILEQNNMGDMCIRIFFDNEQGCLSKSGFFYDWQRRQIAESLVKAWEDNPPLYQIYLKDFKEKRKKAFLPKIPDLSEPLSLSADK